MFRLFTLSFIALTLAAGVVLLPTALAQEGSEGTETAPEKPAEEKPAEATPTPEITRRIR